MKNIFRGFWKTFSCSRPKSTSLRISDITLLLKKAMDDPGWPYFVQTQVFPGLVHLSFSEFLRGKTSIRIALIRFHLVRKNGSERAQNGVNLSRTWLTRSFCLFAQLMMKYGWASFYKDNMYDSEKDGPNLTKIRILLWLLICLENK